ncbi:hypothetical protein BJY04DRAFT_224343 [Aspergillus karnatakaensis]|uniref:uncharacterized protein n=1 Tax=Aspergillus karnatakaensis TaxID=1810916 RepID=UPI003CCD731E
MFSRRRTPSDLSGQTAIITGGYTRLGYVCANALLSRSLSHLIITVRDEKKGQEVVVALQQLYPAANYEVWLLDVHSNDSILAFAQRCEELRQIDCVALNAGLATGNFTFKGNTKLEETFDVDYFSTVLVTFLLLPVLGAKRSSSRPARLTLVCTEACQPPDLKRQTSQPAHLDSLYEEDSEHYPTTKLHLSMFIQKLKEKVNRRDVTVDIAGFDHARNSEEDSQALDCLERRTSVVQYLFARSAAWVCLGPAAAKFDATDPTRFTLNHDLHPWWLSRIMQTPEARSISDGLWEVTLDKLDWADARGLLALLAGNSA